MKRTSWQLASRRTGGSGFNIDKSPKRASRKNSARRPETRRKSLGDADLSNLPIDNGFSWINGYRGYLQWRSSPGRNFLRELEKFSHHPICKRDKYIQFCIQFFLNTANKGRKLEIHQNPDPGPRFMGRFRTRRRRFFFLLAV